MARFRKEKKLRTWRKLAMFTWGPPSDPTVYGTIDIDVSKANAWMAEQRETSGLKITLTHLMGKAVASAIALRPEVNAIIRRGHHVYLRDTIDVFFQVATEGGENLSGVKVREANDKTVVEIAQEMADRVKIVRTKGDTALQKANARIANLPASVRGPMMSLGTYLAVDLGLDLRWAGMPDDPFGSAMVTNVGMFGLPVGLAPLVPFSRTPILLTVGAVQDRPVAVDGRVEVRPIVTVGCTFDHRLLDGYQAGVLAKRFREIVEDPENSNA